ncbi:hypothetical protein ABT337_01170 [Saccharopolyspora hirsuta]|uniref:hypothetical protein n=1 Tax=Saccharopolyspora hirsuta TaxID=1837 RepID=UPI0033266428
MTALADGAVYSRSGLTRQAGLLEKAGIERARETEQKIVRVRFSTRGVVDQFRARVLSEDRSGSWSGFPDRGRSHE